MNVKDIILFTPSVFFFLFDILWEFSYYLYLLYCDSSDSNVIFNKFFFIILPFIMNFNIFLFCDLEISRNYNEVRENYEGILVYTRKNIKNFVFF